ncbi:O-antigen ligase family protein [Streptomyces sp. LHD-70]|uniref:O-antigen ligase family protein n=1 Tax=Streptomyces sp. LHD-70 TaxID=3072140 RepID=UPI0028106877|nr:O-antigen ligase family protein [Streptomyces sp. LHD-70]MDQ8702508.1 O-antigen ligase family protein [Streptomyces sp. LHD-70]
MTSATVRICDGASARRGAADVAGMAILACCALWALITATARGGGPEGVLLAVLALAAGYACGRIGGAVLPVGACAMASAAGLYLAVTASPAVSSADPSRTGMSGISTSPLGHTSPVAALLVLSAGAACCGAWATGRGGLRLVLRLFALGTAAVSAALGSAAGLVGCVAVLLCSLAAARVTHRGRALAGLGLAVGLLVATVWAAAASAIPGGLADTLTARLSGHRVALWQDALLLAERDPALGVGPGRYAEFSAAAQQLLHSDIRPHSAPLQLAAEQGLIGVALSATAFCWLLHALWRSSRSTPFVLTAGLALASVAATATVGNTLSFAAVTVGVGVLAGLATARPLHEDWADADGR